jgi:cytochrome c-type biogenesis protein CcmH/NrfF
MAISNARETELKFAAAVPLLSSTMPLTPQQSAEVKRLEDSLLAPCCYTQSIAQQMSDAAEQMRQQVTEMVASGMSDKEIIEHYRAQYGDRILVVPDGNTGQVLFAFPVVVFIASSGILYFFLQKLHRARRSSPTPGLAAIDGRALQAMKKEMEGLGGIPQ